MDIQLEKYKLMEWLVGLKDETIISKIKNIKNTFTSSTDLGNDISETEKLFIEAGLKDIEKGNTFTHEEVMNEINSKYGI